MQMELFCGTFNQTVVRGCYDGPILSETHFDWRFFRVSEQIQSHKVIREISPYIRARFAFKTGPCQLHVPYLHQLFTYTSLLTPCYHETLTPTLCRGPISRLPFLDRLVKKIKNIRLFSKELYKRRFWRYNKPLCIGSFIIPYKRVLLNGWKKK